MKLVIALLFGFAIAVTEDVVRYFGTSENIVPFICTLLGFWLGVLNECVDPGVRKGS